MHKNIVVVRLRLLVVRVDEAEAYKFESKDEIFGTIKKL